MDGRRSLFNGARQIHWINVRIQHEVGVHRQRFRRDQYPDQEAVYKVIRVDDAVLGRLVTMALVISANRILKMLSALFGGRFIGPAPMHAAHEAVTVAQLSSVFQAGLCRWIRAQFIVCDRYRFTQKRQRALVPFATAVSLVLRAGL
jgi:hypothetical protein